MAELEPIFSDLRQIFLDARGTMCVAEDLPGNLVIKTPWNEPGKKEPAWFGAVQLKRNYVSCHLMPIYSQPELLEGVSPELRKRMQGKSCFNFKRPEPALSAELQKLVAVCAEAFVEPR